MLCNVKLPKTGVILGGIQLSFSFKNTQRADLISFPHKTILVLVWLVGQVIGFYSGSQVPISVVSLMCLPTFGQVSIVWLFFSAAFPFLLSFIALLFSIRHLLISTVFLKAYSFTYSICCIVTAFGSAGWLMQLLCFSTSTTGTLIFLWFIFSYPKYSKTQRSQCLLLCTVSIVSFVCFDYFAIAPFVSALLNR